MIWLIPVIGDIESTRIILISFMQSCCKDASGRVGAMKKGRI